MMKIIKTFVYNNKCGHRNVLSKRQEWMSIFHIINFKKKKNHGHRGPAFSHCNATCFHIVTPKTGHVM
jgi:hypothetical protein